MFLTTSLANLGYNNCNWDKIQFLWGPFEILTGIYIWNTKATGMFHAENWITQIYSLDLLQGGWIPFCFKIAIRSGCLTVTLCHRPTLIHLCCIMSVCLWKVQWNEEARICHLIPTSSDINSCNIFILITEDDYTITLSVWIDSAKRMLPNINRHFCLQVWICCRVKRGNLFRDLFTQSTQSN